MDFSNVTEIKINNKTVKSIKIGEVTIYNTADETILTLTSDKSILSYYDNDEVVLTATLLRNNTPLPNTNITFKQGNTVLDVISTDSQGQAEYTYTSQGVGNVEFSAECDSLMSKINLIDAKYYASNETINLAPRYNNDRILFASDYQVQEGDKIHFRFKNITNHMLWGIGSIAGSDFTFEQVGTTLKYWRNVLSNGSYNNPSFLPNTTEDFVMEYVKYDSTQYQVKIYIGDRYIDYWRCGKTIRKIRIDKYDNSNPSWDIEVFVL